MIDLAKVNMFGQTVGYVRWDGARASFNYDEKFVGSGLNISPLLMPLRRGIVYSFPDLSQNTFKGLPGLLADSLPDTYGRAMLDRWLALQGRRSANPVESLCYMGTRCMGALEYEPVIFDNHNSNKSFELNGLVDVAREALEQKSEFATNLDDDRKKAIADILMLGTSAGGQRAKALIAWNRETGEIRSGQIEAPDGFGYYLIKLDGVTATAGFKETGNFGRLEYSFYQLACKAGIEMAFCDLIEENGRAHFITERFDRMKGEKIHMQTLCGIAHYDFGMLHAYSYEQAFAVMRVLGLSNSESQQMFRRMVFNVIIRNQDDHTKNISFLMDKNGKWSLSPAYDISFSYNPQGQWTNMHQMSVNGKFDNIKRDDLLECARKNDIRNANTIIDEISESVHTWAAIARNCGVPEGMIKDIEPLFIKL